MNAPGNDTAPKVLAHPEAEKQKIQISLCFPEPSKVKPEFPSPQSVKGRVLGSLLRGERLTHLDCWRRFGSARLSHHIYVLRGIGWNVQIVEQTVKTSDAGRPATIGIYYLTPEMIAEAGKPGQQYAAECARIEAERRAA
jgi:hypothetical protein